MRAPIQILIKLTIAPIIAATLMASLPVSADQVRVPIMSQGGNQDAMDLPKTGQTRTTVEERFGTPEGTKGPTGEPPIVQLFYPDFVVYFEGDRVIHSVIKPAR
ncbi:MAG: hypothetical protein WD623_12685 [Marinobacter sp.]|uniref:hypothetical protein n=1 Tax=Marinobacter sp. TaxID=50741 RepID=UPI0034A019F7